MLQKNQLPNRCEICKDRIGLYQPYYTIAVHAHFIKNKAEKEGVTVFCPNCFNAYEQFLTGRQIHENRAQIINDLKNM